MASTHQARTVRAAFGTGVNPPAQPQLGRCRGLTTRAREGWVTFGGTRADFPHCLESEILRTLLNHRLQLHEQDLKGRSGKHARPPSISPTDWKAARGGASASERSQARYPGSPRRHAPTSLVAPGRPGSLLTGAVDLFAIWIEHRDGRLAGCVDTDAYAPFALNIGDHELRIVVFIDQRNTLHALTGIDFPQPIRPPIEDLKTSLPARTIGALTLDHADAVGHLIGVVESLVSDVVCPELRQDQAPRLLTNHVVVHEAGGVMDAALVHLPADLDVGEVCTVGNC